ncbi:MAG: SulP family inorganic anion transporter [Acidimicrobiia bacterium]
MPACPPETGLYTALVAPFAYAIFGTSRQLNVGPSSTVAVMSLAVVTPLAVSDPDRFVELTTALAILVGVIFVIAGFLRLGFIADFMSKPVLDGFIVGLALTIAAGQLHKLFGFETDSENFFEDIWEIITNLDMTNGWTLAVGIASLSLLFGMERLVPRIPAALVVTVLSILAVTALDLEAKGVHVIGEIPSGLPLPGLPSDLTVDDWVALIPGGLGVFIVAFAESVAAARTYANKHKYSISPDQEMVALGASNAAAGFFGGFVVDGSLSKSAAADQAGQKTQMASFVLTAAVFITILFLTGLFANLAEATLGAIVIHAVWHLIDFGKIARYLKVRKDDFWAGLAAMLGVLVFDILAGLAIAVGVSIVFLVARASRPHSAILGRVRDEESDDIAFQSLENHPQAETFPGLIIFRFDADLFFANANVLKEAVRDAIASTEPTPRVVLIDAETIFDVDSTALAAMAELVEELGAEGIEIWMARVKDHLVEMLERADAIRPVHFERLFPSVRAAVEAFTREA